jgi:two-component system phosphate regulon sensor histidine kinase PhoR
VRLRGRSVLASLGVGLSAVVALDAYLSASLRDELEERTAYELERAVRLVADRLAAASGAEPLPELAARLGEASETRVTFIAADGRVLGDSKVPGPRLSELENHLDRPEVAAALHGGTGRAERLSRSVHQGMMYVAVAAPPSAPARVARVARSLTQVEAIVASTRWRLFAGSAIALLTALLASLLVARLATRPVAELTDVARAMAAGDYQRRAHVQRPDEIGALAEAMNQLARELHATMGRLGEERDLLTAILDGMQEGVLVVAPDETVLRVNPALLRTLGVGADARGRSVLAATRLPELAEAAAECLREGAVVSRELATRTVPPRIVMVLIAPLVPQGRARQGAVAVFHDLTAIRRLERVRRDFVSNVSHELRTPVSALRGAAETLLEGALEDRERARSFVDLIHRHAERLSRLIADLLDLSRLESGEVQLAPETVDLGLAARQVVEMLAEPARAKGLTVLQSISGLAVFADPRAVEQVLLNLLDNAVRYTPGGGRVTLSAAREDAAVRVSVVDTGPGIAPQHLPRLFERFYRVDAGRSREVGGTGLGLAIVKHLVEAMGGEVRVESALGVGSTFSFRLPAG